MDRRRFLRRAAPLVAAGLAGCTGGGSETTESPTEEPTDSPTPTDASTPEPTDTPAATESPTEAATASPTQTAEPTPTPPSDPDREVVVGPGGSLRFDPESFEVAVGDTVLWTWDSGGHNVKPRSVPEGSNWAGRAEQLSYPSGTVHWHTFETPGEYEYVCQPHQSAGMVGSFTVTE